MGTSVPGVCPRAGTIYGWLSGAPVCAVTMAAPAQQPNPGVRNAHAAVYDTRHHTLLLFERGHAFRS